MGKAAIIWAALGTCALCAITSSSFAEQPVSACMKFVEDKHLDQQRIEFRLDNTCTKSAACSISWAVTCQGKPARSEASVSIAPAASQGFTASAADCDGRWEIGGASWSCKLSP